MKDTRRYEAMRSLSDAVTYPMESDEWIKTIIIGGILMFLSFLLIPLFVVYGYLVKVIRDSTTGKPAPPPFSEWKQLLVDGLQVFIIGVIYMLIPLIVGAVTVGGAVFSMATGTDTGAAVGLGGLFVGLGLTFLLALLFGYIAAAAVVNFAREEQFGAAFDMTTLKAVIFHRDYATAWLLSVVVVIAASIIAGFFNVIPLLGAAIGAVINFYVAIVAAVLWADGFSDALDQPDTADRPGVEESAI